MHHHSLLHWLGVGAGTIVAVVVVAAIVVIALFARDIDSGDNPFQ